MVWKPLQVTSPSSRTPRVRRLSGQGEPGTKLYYIGRGEVEVVARDADGRERRVNVLGEGEYFGEVALLRETPRTATVRTISSCQLYTLNQADFRLLQRQLPELELAIAETAAGRLADTETKLSKEPES